MSCGCGCSGEVVAYEEWDEEDVSAAEYQGRSVSLNKPFRTKGGPKKFAVYTKNGSGTVVIVRFGDPNMEIKRDDPARRKSFRARHNCKTPGPKWKARYWSCRQWRGGKKVEAGMEDYIFSTPEGARQKSTEIGFGGEIHSDQMADGTPMYFPAPNEEEFQMWFDKNDSHDASASECNCGNVEAAEPTPNDTESHDEYMTRCQEAGYSKEECMKAHEGHTFEEEASYDDEEKKKYASIQECDECSTPEDCIEKGCSNPVEASTCGLDEELINGICQKVAVTLDLDFDEIEAIVEASTGNTVIEIRGVAFHEGMNKNKWALTEEGAKLVAEQMKGADLTLNHPEASEHGSGFTRNMDGGVEEAVVGYIKGATFHKTVSSGYEVRYVAHVVRTELFDALESGLWSRDNYGVSIGGSGVPVEASEDGMLFGEDFKFDHLAIVHKPAYQRATIDSIRKIEATASKATFIGHSQSDSKHNKVIKMTEEENTVDYAAEIEALKASLVLANSRVGEFEAKEEARVEASRQTLVDEASELGMSGHEDLSSDTLTSLIASWNEAHPTPTEVEMTPIESVEKPVSEAIASESKAKVSNYLNGRIVENDEDLYAKGWNAWASAWNKTLAVGEGDKMKAPSYDTIKEMR